MDIHQNARLTLRSREAMVLYVLAEGFTRKAAAAAFRVSARTVAKWGCAVPARGSSRAQGPKLASSHSPQRVEEAIRERVIELRRSRRAAEVLEALANLLMENSPTSMRATKALLVEQNRVWLDATVEAAMAANAEVRETGDFREGVAAFLEKRKALWEE